MTRVARAKLFAWSLWALCAVLAALGVAVVAWGYSGSGPAPDLEPLPVTVVFFVAFLAFPAVGALIATRLPKNPVGWVMCAAAVAWSIQLLTEAYAESASVRPGVLPAPSVVAWLAEWMVFPALALVAIVLPLVFPDGRLLSPRWRIVLWLAAAGGTAGILAEALEDGPVVGGFANPVGIVPSGDALDAFRAAAIALFVAAVVAAALSLVLRFRRARGTERQQLKWLAYVAALVPTALALGVVPVEVLNNLGWPLALVMVWFGVPLAVGIAVLRYRLYDVDLIIRRTLVYGVLTAGLAGLYFGVVIALQQVFSSFAGGSDLAIAGSTLAVAALFGPARRRIQAIVDRRFYRRRYDAAKTLEAFSARLREEVDLASLSVELRRVVDETMQPVHVSLWLQKAVG